MTSFSLDVKKFADSFSDGAEKAIRGASIELFTAIIKSTPVDEGRARGNWFATGLNPSERVTNSKDKSGQKATVDMTNKVLSLVDYSQFTLTNNLPYINKLEFGGYPSGPNTVNGFSKQAPAGMVRVNITRFNGILNKQAKKSLPK